MTTSDTPAPANRPSSGTIAVQSWNRDGDKRGRSTDLRILARLWPYVWRRPADLAAAVFFLLLAAAASLSITGGARLLVDRGFGSGRAEGIDRWFLLLAAIAGVMAVASACRFYFVTKIGERVVADLRRDVYAHLLGLSASWFAKVPAGEAISRLTTDAALIETLVGSSVSIALRNIITTLAALVLLAVISPLLTGLLLLLIPAILVPLFALGGRVRRLSTLSQDRVADAASNASEAIEAREIVQAFGREDFAIARFSGAVEAAFAAARRRIRARAFMTALLISLIFGGIAGVLWFGARQVMTDGMSPGALAQFVFLAIFAASGAASLTEVWGDVQRATGAAQRLVEILDTEPAIRAPAHPRRLPDVSGSRQGLGEIIFDNVRFSYPAAEPLPRPGPHPDPAAGPPMAPLAALHGVSFHIKPGENVAIVGPSGAGKSTLFKLLLRFYDCDAGAITMDGVEALGADPREWRQRFAYVSQDAALFSGSASDNIGFGRADAPEAAIRDAAARAEALGFIEAREGGLHAPLGDRARGLSGGERQRLVIARALVREAPVLLLDEATSALDSRNEQLVQKALSEAMTGRTTLVIAHRLATVLRADRILVMDNGRIVEEGPHTDLVARNGLYARLASLQFAPP